ncbi:MAG: hypothetical protein PVH13_03200 [Gammaproteobacteria bacterium]|jgi:hypothetical protein
MEPQNVAGEETPTRWQIFRSLLVFQYKLLIDATKDFLLSPLALAAALVDIVRPTPSSRMLFPALMRLGRKAERAINLFGRGANEGEWTVDRLVDTVETSIRQHYQPGDQSPTGGQSPTADHSPKKELKGEKEG